MELPIFKISLTKVKSYTFLDVLKGEAWNRSQKYCIKEKDSSHYGKATKRKKGFDSWKLCGNSHVINQINVMLLLVETEMGHGFILVSVSSVVEFQRWLVSIIWLKEVIVFLWIKWLLFFQKVSKLYVTDWFFLILFHWNHFFWTTLFFNIMPNFWQTDIHCIHKIQWFHLSTLIFGQNLFEIPQQSWHWY